MKALLQRVAQARVEVAGETVGEIASGLLVFLGVEQGDDAGRAERLAARALDLRIFPDAAKPMNRSLRDVGGAVLVVSQFTLAADTRSGRRPGFSTAAAPALAEPLYAAFVEACRSAGLVTRTGRFGAEMQVHLVNDGPVTFLLES
ncbi:MAG: D-aminoacyl-tRNA deacylase [Pseudomonadales bacterium]|jgi:D-tyrosyl-tRNA(Tyr) deacylase|nr:D-aminoacyl-tRNA deacylase [Pseudomonadales bacterium]